MSIGWNRFSLLAQVKLSMEDTHCVQWQKIQFLIIIYLLFYNARQWNQPIKWITNEGGSNKQEQVCKEQLICEWIDCVFETSCHISTSNCTKMDTHAWPNTKPELDHLFPHQAPSHCHCKPMGFISASFKTTTLIPTPTLQSQMLSIEGNTNTCLKGCAYEFPQKKEKRKSRLIYILCSHLTGLEKKMECNTISF